jgi:kanamycin kinase
VYDSSCSPEARVYFIDKDGGYYLKTCGAGTLKREAEMTAYFHKKGIGAEVLTYLSQASADWLLTAAVSGEDCTHGQYLAEPKRLCDTIAERLRWLHEVDFSDCPIQNRNAEYLALAEQNYRTGNYDKTAFPDSFGYRTAEEAYRVLDTGRSAFQSDVLLHGDYCLPNIMLDHWKLSGFIDVGNGGVGDRHIDLFWGVWTLWFNLKTDQYASRFLDAYGRDRVNTEMLRVIAAAEVFG